MAARVISIISTETFAGKTALCAGLAHWLQGTGRRVGYLKPLTIPLPGDDPEAGDDDALVMQRLLRLDLAPRDLAPVWLDAGTVARLVRIAGRAAATRLLLTGEPITAGEALARGLVSGVYPPADVWAEAQRLAEVVAARGPLALRFAKEAVRRGP